MYKLEYKVMILNETSYFSLRTHLASGSTRLFNFTTECDTIFYNHVFPNEGVL